MKDKKIVITVKNHTEPEIDQDMAKKLKEMAIAGKTGQVIKEKAYIFSTLDYPEKLTYTNGEVIMVAPKAKEVVDASLIDKSALAKGLLLKLV